MSMPPHPNPPPLKLRTGMPSPLWVEGERACPLTSLALRASVNGLTDSPFVLYGAHYSSHQHPSSAKAADGHVLSPGGEEEEQGRHTLI